MSEIEKLQKAVDEAYMKVLEANEEYDQALSKLEYYQETENSLEKQLAEATKKLNKIESVCVGYKGRQSEYETGTEIPYWDIMNIIKEKDK